MSPVIVLNSALGVVLNPLTIGSKINYIAFFLSFLMPDMSPCVTCLADS